LRAAPRTVELCRRRAQTWLLDSGLPGPMVRMGRNEYHAETGMVRVVSVE
jgi:hypothetical protein